MSFDQQKESLLRNGIVYVLKYLGSIEIYCSMRQLQFNERRKLTRECIKEVFSRSNEGRSHQRSADFSEFVSNDMVSRNADFFLSGVEVLLTVSVDMLKVSRKDTNQVFLSHKMELVSFASGGEGSTSNCIAYVAKDETNRRICYILQSLSGMESVIISTIGQAFDLKYSDSLKHETNVQNESFADNDTKDENLNGFSSIHHNATSTNRGHNNVIDEHNTTTKEENADFKMPVHQPIPIRPNHDTHIPMQGQVLNKKSAAAENLDSELWFHGNISRAKAEELLRNDGDFLVRKCTQIPGQYVLSGRYANQPRHLLLVDPEGVVRTRGCRFDSISHLIYHHQQKRISIVSPDSELLLINPIIRSKRS